MGIGRVLILNGASSAGKSTIAEKFASQRAADGEWWLTIALDDYLAKVAPEWFAAGEHRGPFSVDGIRFVPCELGLRVEIGDKARQLLTWYRQSVAAAARLGFDVVVDEVAVDDGAVGDWEAALAGLDVTWVAVRCDADVAAAREAARGDREIGLARAQTAVVHLHANYDIELDTTDTPADELVARLIDALC